MIVGLIGPHACGKTEMANYLEEFHGFKVIDFQLLFQHYSTMLTGDVCSQEAEEKKL